MIRLTSLLLATAMALPAATAVAQDNNHEISIERLGYFPAKVYLQPGDTVTFTNNKPWRVTVNSFNSGDNLSGYNNNAPCALGGNNNTPRYSGSMDGFALIGIGAGQSQTITIHECTENRIREPNFGAYYNSSPLYTFFEFGEAPNGS